MTGSSTRRPAPVARPAPATPMPTRGTTAAPTATPSSIHHARARPCRPTRSRRSSSSSAGPLLLARCRRPRPRPRLGRRRLLKQDDVLPGEEFERILEREPLGLELAADLGEGHLVLGLDRD